ncbi:MAG: hypothetical protein AB7O80_13530 [Acetobacteraceae bacterium]
MTYLPPFESLKSYFTLTNFRGKLTATAPFDEVRRMISALLAGVHVDEEWYLERNPDIARGVRDGIVKSGKEHFINNGYFEGRMPFRIQVDEEWYLEQYPEVAEAIRGGVMDSAQQHFEEHGYKEGRRPGPA